MPDERTTDYARAIFAVAKTERRLGEVEDELFRFARVIEANDELRSALTDPHIPASRRQQIVEDLLGGRASDVTVALVSLVVGTGRGAHLPAIIDALVEMSAEEKDKKVAEVRTPVELSDDQKRRLAVALSQRFGGQFEVKVIVDPSVLGGIVTQVGDTVIDGSVRHLLTQLKESI